MTVRELTIENYGVLMFAVGPRPGLVTLGQAELDADGQRWKVTVADETTWHTSQPAAERALRFYAYQLVGGS